MPLLHDAPPSPMQLGFESRWGKVRGAFRTTRHRMVVRSTSC